MAVDTAHRLEETSAGPVEIDVLIIGGGFAGLCMAIALKRKARLSFVVLERAAGPGGTWRDNTYPGCACDIQSYLYSYSFEPYAGWSRLYPPQPEILAYLEHCIRKYRLAADIHVNTEVREARFNEHTRRWAVETSGEKRFSARILVSAMGGLSRPEIPKLRGRERFAGASFHSARWDHKEDLAGRRVAVIGTGASAIQFIPRIAAASKRLWIFQRTAPWILPRPDRAIGQETQARLSRFPVLMRLSRNRIYLRQEALGVGFVSRPNWMRFVENLSLKHLEKSVTDPALRRILTPHYRMGCKRVLISNDYLPCLNRPNVTLIDKPVLEMVRDGIVTEDGRFRPVDVVIYATGFRATEFLSPLRIIGRQGQDLNEAWRAGAHAYLGVTVPKFPNFFLLLGPNTGLGHNSIIFMIEAQVRYTMRCLERFERGSQGTVEVKDEVEQAFNQSLQKKMRRTVWATGCHSWYQHANGKNVTLWPGFTFDYWWKTRHFNEDDYRLDGAP